MGDTASFRSGSSSSLVKPVCQHHLQTLKLKIKINQLQNFQILKNVLKVLIKPNTFKIVL